MKLRKNQPFWTAVILHLVVLIGLFLGTIVEAFKPKEKPHVFEMVDMPSQQQSVATPAPPTPPPDVPMPELPPVPDLASVPEPVATPPAPTPPPPARVTPVPTPPTPGPKVMTEREFQERFGTPAPRQPTRPTTPRSPVSVPTIDVPRPIFPSNPTANSPRPLTQQQLSALEAYSARLRSRIDTAWAKPASLAGVRIAATVVFDVSATGRITNARLKPGSGNSAFDQSVLAAFRKVISAGPTPTGQAHSFTMTFRMTD